MDVERVFTAMPEGGKLLFVDRILALSDFEPAQRREIRHYVSGLDDTQKQLALMAPIVRMVLEQETDKALDCFQEFGFEVPTTIDDLEPNTTALPTASGNALSTRLQGQLVTTKETFDAVSTGIATELLVLAENFEANRVQTEQLRLLVGHDRRDEQVDTLLNSALTNEAQSFVQSEVNEMSRKLAELEAELQPDVSEARQREILINLHMLSDEMFAHSEDLHSKILSEHDRLQEEATLLGQLIRQHQTPTSAPMEPPAQAAARLGAASADRLTEDHLDEMGVSQLRTLCERRGLNTGGSRDQLAQHILRGQGEQYLSESHLDEMGISQLRNIGVARGLNTEGKRGLLVRNILRAQDDSVSLEVHGAQQQLGSEPQREPETELPPQPPARPAAELALGGSGGNLAAVEDRMTPPVTPALSVPSSPEPSMASVQSQTFSEISSARTRRTSFR